MTESPGLTFRGLQSEADFVLVLGLLHESYRADGISVSTTLDEIVRAYALTDKFDPSRNILIASLEALPGRAPVPIGYSRVGWYSGLANVRVYHQTSWLLREYRDLGLWPALIRQNERRLREIAVNHLATKDRFFQAWATDKQTDWMSVLEGEGYRVARRFNNMLHTLDKVPDNPMPAGFELRPAQPEHLRLIWEAQKEMNAGLFENVAEDWTEEKYPAWREAANRNLADWQLAWEGDQFAGMVLAHFDVAANEGREKKRGYTEHIYVRQPWRHRGLASALIAHSLRVLRAQGMQEVELGVDAENESAAFRLYQSLGYQTFSVDTWFRKPMVQ